MLDHSYEEPFIRYANTFNWRGEKFKLKPNSIINMETELDEDNFNLFRTDSTKSGSLIIIEQISLLDKYLEGPAKKPFKNPRSNYLIAIRKVYETDYKAICEKVLEKLWNDYGIANAILFSPCAIQNDVSLRNFN